jgi:hypothetical protein
MCSLVDAEQQLRWPAGRPTTIMATAPRPQQQLSHIAPPRPQQQLSHIALARKGMLHWHNITNTLLTIHQHPTDTGSTNTRRSDTSCSAVVHHVMNVSNPI